MTEALPKFSNPPVTEMALGVEFAAIPSWQIPHFGLFWQLIRDEYPNVQVQPSLPEQYEKFGAQTPSFKIDLSFQPQYRCWFFDQNQNWLVQVQNNRFLNNWKIGGGKYPGHVVVIDRFTSEWERFKEFLNTERLTPPQPLQVEATYINHIEDAENLEDVFPAWQGISKDGFLPKPENVTVNTVFVIPENRGRLYVNVAPAIRHSDMKLIMQLSVTAKVLIASNNEDGMQDSLELAHKWAVKGFEELTSEKTHRLWGREK